MPIKRRVRHGGDLISSVKKAAHFVAPYAKRIGQAVLPEALKYGKEKLLPMARAYAKKKIPALEHLGLGHRRKAQGSLQAQRLRNLAKARAALKAKRGRKDHDQMRGSGWWSDFGNGILSGVSSIAQPIAQAAIPALTNAAIARLSSGAGHRRRRVGGSTSGVPMSSGVPIPVDGELLAGRHRSYHRKHKVGVRDVFERLDQLKRKRRGRGLNLEGQGLQM